MIQTAGSKRQSAFSHWIRTGRVAQVSASADVELKFNPWHDPADGRFTFAGAGRYDGPGPAGPRDRMPGAVARRHRSALQVTTDPKPGAPRAERFGHVRKAVAGREPAAAALRPVASSAGEFVAGVGEGLAGVAKGTVESARSLLTTNPATTARNVGRGIANTIDMAIAAEDTPATVQISRAADALAYASARDIGRATGSVVGDVAIAALPGAALGKLSALRSMRAAALRPTFDPPHIVWVKENLTSEKPWKAYNDGAHGARPGQASALILTKPDGSVSRVKFDGILADYPIERKWAVMKTSKARAQILRQSQVLAQHRLIGVWEVPNAKAKAAALKVFREMNVTNIRVRIVKP